MVTIRLTWFCVVLSMVLSIGLAWLIHAFVYAFAWVSSFCPWFRLVFMGLSMGLASFLSLNNEGGRKVTRGSHQKTKGERIETQGPPNRRMKRIH